jgi:hypothetical protein
MPIEHQMLWFGFAVGVSLGMFAGYVFWHRS